MLLVKLRRTMYRQRSLGKGLNRITKWSLIMKCWFFRHECHVLVCFFYLLYCCMILICIYFLSLQSLGFDLIVYAPYRAIEGFVSDMEACFLSNLCFLILLLWSISSGCLNNTTFSFDVFVVYWDCYPC